MDRWLIVGFDEPQSRELTERLNAPCLTFPTLPCIVVENGELFVESRSGRYLRVTRVLYQAILEHDVEFLSGLALWEGPCFPEPLALIDARRRIPFLVRALRHTRFGGFRDFVSPRGLYSANGLKVAKWGDWHCGENKRRFTDTLVSEEASLIEPFVEGEAVRLVIVDQPRQIRLAGPDWLKSVHSPGAALMPADERLVEDTRRIRSGLALDLIGVDYILAETGPYLLEVNHIPSVTCLPELWEDYLTAVLRWSSSLSPSD
jgi:hypothetical protein